MKMFLRLLTFAIILTFAICGCDLDLDPEPCTFEVGDVIKTTAFSGGKVKYVNLSTSGCDNVILKIIGDPVLTRPGDTVKYRVVKVNSSHSYDVRVIK